MTTPTLGPSPDAIDAVIDTLEACLNQQPDARLDMLAPTIRFTPPAAYSACLASWYWLATHPDEACRLTASSAVADPQRPCTPLYYHKTAEHFAQALGMPSARALTAWAKAHPDDWGNPQGHLLFQSMSAYAVAPRQPPPAERFDVICRHFRAIAQRLRRNTRQPHRRTAESHRHVQTDWRPASASSTPSV